NTLDIVPMGYENISGLMGMYPKPSQTLWDYSGVLWLAVSVAQSYMQTNNIVYSQTNLGGVGTTDSFSGPPVSNLSYTAEAEAQPDHTVYRQHVTPAMKRACGSDEAGSAGARPPAARDARDDAPDGPRLRWPAAAPRGGCAAVGPARTPPATGPATRDGRAAPYSMSLSE